MLSSLSKKPPAQFMPRQMPDNASFRKRSLQSNKQSLIDWVNSLDSPRCMLADKAQDFKDGIILCQIVSMILHCPTFPGIIQQPQSNEESLLNYDIALNKITNNTIGIEVPAYLKTYSATEFHQVMQYGLQIYQICQSNDYLFDLLSFLKYCYQNKSQSNSTKQHDSLITQNCDQSLKFTPTIDGGFCFSEPPSFARCLNNHVDNSQFEDDAIHPQSVKTSFQQIQKLNESSQCGQQGLQQRQYNSEKTQKFRQSFRNKNPAKCSASALNISKSFLQDKHYDSEQVTSKQSFTKWKGKRNHSQISPNSTEQHRKHDDRKIEKGMAKKKKQHNFNSNQGSCKTHKFLIKKSKNNDSRNQTKRTMNLSQASSLQKYSQNESEEEIQRERRSLIVTPASITDRQQRKLVNNQFSKSSSILSSSYNTVNSTTTFNPFKGYTSKDKIERVNQVEQEAPSFKSTTKRNNPQKSAPRPPIHQSKVHVIKSTSPSPLNQKLTKKNNQRSISPVNQASKSKILSWLSSEISLIRRQVLGQNPLAHLPDFCRNGVLFCDLLNRLHGRSAVITGIHRKPKNMSHVNANFSNFLGFLRKQSKMNSRYLWSAKEVIDGQIDVIWGLLDDIWHWDKNKLSPYDPAALSILPYKTNSLNSQRKPSARNSLQNSMFRKQPKQNQLSTQKMNIQSDQQHYAKQPFNSESSSPFNDRTEEFQNGNKISNQSSPRSSIKQLHSYKSNASSNFFSAKQNSYQPLSSFRNRQQIDSLLSSRKCRTMFDPRDTNQHSILNSSYKSRHSRSPSRDQNSFLAQKSKQNTIKSMQSIKRRDKTPPPPDSSRFFRLTPQKDGQIKMTSFSIAKKLPPRTPPPHNTETKVKNEASKFHFESSNTPFRYFQPNSQASLPSARQNCKTINLDTSRTMNEYNTQSQNSSRNTSFIMNKKLPPAAASSSQYVINNYQQKLTRDWLLQLRLNARLVQQNLPMLQNPLRNGVLLCELIGMLQTDGNPSAQIDNSQVMMLDTIKLIEYHFTQVNYRPKNAEQMRKNIFLAFEVLLARYPSQLSQEQQNNTFSIQSRRNSNTSISQQQTKHRKHYSKILKSIINDPFTGDYIIRGERDAIWAILNTLRLFYNDVVQINSTKNNASSNSQFNSVQSSPRISIKSYASKQVTQKTSNTTAKLTRVPNSSQTVSLVAARASLQLPYSTLDLRKLQLSILRWMNKNLQIITMPCTQQSIDYNQTNNPFSSTSISQWASQLRNGTLLVLAVQQVLQVRIAGTFKQPRTDATAMANIRKALAALRKQPRMSQRFMWSEKEIFNGDQGTVLGLFQDLHRFYCGLPQRKGTLQSDYFKDGPFLGQEENNMKMKMKEIINSSRIMHEQQQNNQQKDGDDEEEVGENFESFGNTDDASNFDYQIQNKRKVLINPNPLAPNRRNVVMDYQSSKDDDILSTYLSYQNDQNQVPVKTDVRNYHCQGNQDNKRRNNLYKRMFSPKQSQSQIGVDDGILKCRNTNTLQEKPNNYNIKPASYPTGFQSKTKNNRFDDKQNSFKRIKKYDNTNKPSEMTFQRKRELNLVPQAESAIQTSIQAQYSQVNDNTKRTSIQQQHQQDGDEDIKNQDTQQSNPPTFKQLKQQNNKKVSRNTPSSCQSSFMTGCENSGSQFIQQYKEAQSLKKWLVCIPNLNVDEKIDLNSPVIPQFSSGLLLCELVGQLEMKDIVGVTKQPKSSASALHNIRKALAVLKNKPTIPIYLTYAENEIFQGENQTIISLLKALRYTYKMRFNSSSSSSSNLKGTASTSSLKNQFFVNGANNNE